MNTKKKKKTNTAVHINCKFVEGHSEKENLGK